jgi:hypothetical protein
MEYRYADTYDCEETKCYACRLDISKVTHTSYENPSSHECFTGKADHVMVHFKLCLPCGDKIRGTVLTEGQKLRRDHMLRMVDAFVEEENARL